jgi:hypothetical protein
MGSKKKKLGVTMEIRANAMKNQDHWADLLENMLNAGYFI